MVLFMMVVGMGILSAFLQVVHAQNMHANVITELENSDYAKPVLKEAFEVAEACFYELEISLYSEEGVLQCKTVEDLPNTAMEIDMADIVLRYTIEIPFLQIHLKQALFGYGR